MGRFGGMYGGMGGLMGAPGVPDGRSTPPWHGWSGLRKKMGVIGNFRVRGQVFTYVKVDKENRVALGVCMAVWGV